MEKVVSARLLRDAREVLIYQHMLAICARAAPA
ncbi:protein of unknown function [Hyphomicrobium sp. 1Nfss2.1]